MDVTDDVTGPPAITGMLEDSSRTENTVYGTVSGGDDGEAYKVTFTCDTTNGEIAVEEDLIIEVKEL